MKARNLSLGAEARSVASARIFGRVGELPAFRRGAYGGVFCALPDEPDTGGVAERWRAAGKRIVVRASRATPCGSASIAIRRHRGRGHSGSPNRTWGRGRVRPGRSTRRGGSRVAVTAGTVRLGRGKGYYDRCDKTTAGGVPRGDGRGLLCAPTGRGAALRTARRGGGRGVGESGFARSVHGMAFSWSGTLPVEPDPTYLWERC